MKWGSAFPASYVNVLYNAVSDNLTGEFRFICITNEPEGIHPDVEIIPIPEMGLPDEAWRSGAWPKIAVFKDGLLPNGSRVLFIDLDTMINGALDIFFERHGDFEAIGPDTWDRPQRDKPWIYKIGKPIVGKLSGKLRRSKNSRNEALALDVERGSGAGELAEEIPPNTMGTGIFAFDAGAHGDIYRALLSDIDGALQKYINEQHFVQCHLPEWTEWPIGSVASFKYHLRQPLIRDIFVHPPPPPKSAPILAFHGNPRPLDMATKIHSSRRELPHVWIGRIKWFRDYWEKYNRVDERIAQSDA